MSKNFFLFILILLSQNLSAQFQDWETITNMNNVKSIAIIDDAIWAATDGGAFIYNRATSEVQKWTNTNGLKSVNIQAITVDASGNIITGSKEGDLQVYDIGSKEWDDISFTGNTITDIIVKDDTIWVATESENFPGKTIAAFIKVNGQYEFNDFFVNFPDIASSINQIALYNKQIWLATDKGLFSAQINFSSMSDPENWRLFTTDDGLPANNILSFSILDNTLWAGTENGLAVIDDNSVIGSINTFDGRTINRLLKKDNTLLVTSGRTLYHFSPEAGIQKSTSYTKNISALAIDDSNSIWLGLEKGGIQNSEADKPLLLDGPAQNQLRFVIQDKAGRIWASHGKFKLTPDKGFSLYENGIWQAVTFQGKDWSGMNGINYIYEDRFDNIWLASWGGTLAVYDGKEYTYLNDYTGTGKRITTTKDTIISEDIGPNPVDRQGFFSPALKTENYGVITGFKEDFNGNLWIVNSYASNEKYLAVAPFNSNGTINLDKNNWTYFGRVDGLEPTDGYSSITFDDFGRVWVGGNGIGLYLLDYNNTLTSRADDSYTYFKVNNSTIISDDITALATDNDGVVWIGTRGGLHSFDGQNVFRHFGDTGPVDNLISQIVVDKFNNKWVATAGGLTILKGGLSPFDPDAWIQYTTENSGLVHNSVNSVYIDNDRAEALIATEGGLSIFKGSFAEVQKNFNAVVAGPNPFILDGENDLFTIRKLKDNSIVKILNLNGKLIKTLTANNKQVDGSRAKWNGRDSNGHVVASGIYLYLAFTEDGKSVGGKIAVVRK
jgi:ligand-binding sensor domain-containing protein